MSAINQNNHHSGTSRAAAPPKVTSVLSSIPVSEDRAYEVLTEFLAAEQNRLTPLDLLSHSWHDLHGMAESLATTEMQRVRLRDLLLIGANATLSASSSVPTAMPPRPPHVQAQHVVFDREENDDDDEGDPNARTEDYGHQLLHPDTDRASREAQHVRKEAKKAKKEAKKAKKEAKKKRKRGNESS